MRKKTKVKPVSPEELSAIMAKVSKKMLFAHPVQLHYAITHLAESIVNATTDCPDQNTHRAAALSIIDALLDESVKKAFGKDAKPISELVN